MTHPHSMGKHMTLSLQKKNSTNQFTVGCKEKTRSYVVSHSRKKNAASTLLEAELLRASWSREGTETHTHSHAHTHSHSHAHAHTHTHTHIHIQRIYTQNTTREGKRRTLGHLETDCCEGREKHTHAHIHTTYILTLNEFKKNGLYAIQSQIIASVKVMRGQGNTHTHTHTHNIHSH